MRVIRPGGLLGFSVGVHMDEWEEEHKKLEEAKKWKAEYRSEEEIPVLASVLKDDDSMDSLMARVYVFRKL